MFTTQIKYALNILNSLYEQRFLFNLRVVRVAACSLGRVMQPHIARACMLPPPPPPPVHHPWKQPPPDAPRSDLLQGKVSHLQISKHGGLQKDSGPVWKSSPAHRLQQLVRKNAKDRLSRTGSLRVSKSCNRSIYWKLLSCFCLCACVRVVFAVF